VRFGFTGLEALLATGKFGVATIVGWLITLIAGPVAAIQLFRLRPTGRIATAVLFGSMLIYYVAGLFAFRQPQAPAAPIITLCVTLATLVVVVLSPAAKRLCAIAAVTATSRD
jgi:ABC-type Mn2+/Zn2+ transport system permease subunit